MAGIPSVSLKERLEQAILGFGQLAGCVCQGALVQLWRPVFNARTGTCDDLQTKDQPWSIQGHRGSDLDHFRSASQEVTFSADGNGASSGTVQVAMQQQEVSVFADVCKMPEGSYERAEAAAKCGVRGCMLVPLFPHKDLTLAGPVAVLELIQLESDVSCFPPLFTWLLEKLPMLNLHTPRGIAHWYDRTGRDIMARPHQPRPLEGDPARAARSASPTTQQQPTAADTAQRSAPASAAAVGAAVSEPQSEARPGRGGGCGEAAAASAAAAGSGGRAPHRGAASSAESPAGSRERPQALAQLSDKAECSARGKSGAVSVAAGDQQRSPGSHASAGTLGNSHVSEAEHQLHELASIGEEPDEAPKVHRRRTPLADSGEDSGESSGRAVELPFDKVKEQFGVSLTEAAARLGVHRQDLVRSCRQHNLDGWPRFSMSVNKAARSADTPVSSLPSDVDAADMAAFVPFGPRAHRTTPASSWHTHSTHRQGDRGSGGEGARPGKACAAACNSAAAGGHAAQMLLPDAEPIGSPQEDGESNDWVGYAKGLMLPVQSPRQNRTHWEGLGAAAAAQPPRSANAADSAQRQPPSSCWQKDDPFGDEDWELLRQPLPPQGGIPPSGSAYTGTSLAACLGLHGEHGISAADIAEAAALIGMAPGQPEHPSEPESCRRDLLEDLDMAAAQSNIDSLASPAQEIRLAFERGVCASARAPFSRQPSSVGSEGQHQEWCTPLPKGADLPCTSGTTISDMAKAAVAEREAVESREQGRERQRHAGGAGRGRKRGSGRGRGRGRGNRRLAVATARAGGGPGPLRGGGRARTRRIQRAAAALECDTEQPGGAELAEQPEDAETPLEAEPAAVHADRILEEALEQCQEFQEAEEAAAEVRKDADVTAAAADVTSTPEVSPVVLQAAEPAASEPMLREMYPVPVHSAPARRTRSQPLLLMQRSRDSEEVTSAPPMTSAPQPCSSAGTAAAATAAPQEPPRVAGDAAAPQCGIAAGAPAPQPAAAAAAPEPAGRSEPCSRQPSAQPQLPAQPAAAAAPLPNPAAAAGPGRPRPASNNSGSGGGSRGGPRKRGRPPQMVPHPHTGVLVPKRDLIKARIDPETGEQRATKKRKSKAAAGAPDRDASPEEEEEILPVDVTFSGPSRSNKHKRPVKKSRKMIEAEEAQAFTEAEVGTPERDAAAAAAAAGAAKMAAEASHAGSVGAAALECAQVQRCFDLDAPRSRNAPETPTRGTSALVYMNTPTSRHRNALLASPTARKFPTGEQEMICNERLPEQLPEPNEAALENFLADALAFSPPRPLSGTAPSFFGGGSFLDGGGDGGSLAVSPLPCLDHQMFYGGPLGDLGAAAFTELADSSFSFGCFT
ncbi:g6929 [Coccomyxa elongata]